MSSKLQCLDISIQGDVIHLIGLDSAYKSSTWLNLPLENLCKTTSRFTPFKVIELLWSYCDSILHHRSNHERATNWNNASDNVYLNRIEFTRAGTLSFLHSGQPKSPISLVNTNIRSIHQHYAT